MSRLSTALAFALLLVTGSGCILTVDPMGGYNGAYNDGYVEVYSAPPAPRREYRSAAPGRGYVWVDGFWTWRRNRWQWVNGHWERERVGYVWVAPRYESRGGRHVYVGGGWKQSGYGNAQGSNNGNGNGGYKSGGSDNKCPDGYVWLKGKCLAKTNNY